MRIVVLNGSPQGDTSVTMQCVRYTEQAYPQHELDIVHVAKGLRRLERDTEAFHDVIDRVRGRRRSVGLPTVRLPDTRQLQALHRTHLGAIGRRRPCGQDGGRLVHVHSLLRPHGPQLSPRHLGRSGDELQRGILRRDAEST
jgi:hypothetical protein